MSTAKKVITFPTKEVPNEVELVSAFISKLKIGDKFTIKKIQAATKLDEDKLRLCIDHINLTLGDYHIRKTNQTGYTLELKKSKQPKRKANKKTDSNRVLIQMATMSIDDCIQKAETHIHELKVLKGQLSELKKKLK